MSMYQKMVEKDPTKYPARMGKKWDDDEVLKLLKSIQKKKPYQKLLQNINELSVLLILKGVN